MKMKTSIIIKIICCALLCASSAFAANMVRVPGGTFQRGSANGDDDERPVRTIRMSSFSMMATPVTEAQYQQCVNSGRCTPANYDNGRCLVWGGRGFRRVNVPQNLRGDNLPVVCVTWQQARAYCASQSMRLPTEAQWEYAALGGASSARYSWGNAAPSNANCALGQPRPVGSFSPNGYGLYDMTGNVWEWTADFYAADHYETSGDADPAGPAAGYYRVIRGGGFYSRPNDMRIQNRNLFAPNASEVSLGFRCVR